MKAKYSLLIVLAVPLTILSIIAVAKQEITSNVVDTSENLPPGDWTFSAHPDLRKDIESVPALAVSVLSEANKGLTISRIDVQNLSKRTITAVKFGWYLATKQNKASSLLTGQTPLVTVSGQFQPGQTKQVNFPLVTFAKVAKNLMRNGELKGDFRIDVVVAEVQYEDGNIWKREKTMIADPRDVSRKSEDGGCADQHCSWSTAKSSYECVTSEGELCSNNGNSCLNSRCKGAN